MILFLVICLCLVFIAKERGHYFLFAHWKEPAWLVVGEFSAITIASFKQLLQYQGFYLIVAMG